MNEKIQKILIKPKRSICRTFALLLLLGIPWMAFAVYVHNELDWRIFACLSSAPPLPVAKEVALVDVPYNENLDQFRIQVSSLLNALADNSDALPKIVVLDIWISADDRGLNDLLESVRRLQNANVNIYASVNPKREGAAQIDPTHMKRHAQSFYDILDGQGHTVIDHLYGIAKYDPELEISIGTMGSVHLLALPVMIAVNHYKHTLTSTTEPIIINMGDLTELHKRTYTFHHGEGSPPIFKNYQSGGGDSSPPAKPDFREKVVVVGSLAQDRNAFQGLSGAEIVSFAISERIQSDDSAQRLKPLASPLLSVVLAIVFAVLAVRLFFLLFHRFKRLRSNLLLLGILSACIWLIVLGLFVFVLSPLNYYPPVTLAGFGIIISTVLSGLYTHLEKSDKLRYEYNELLRRIGEFSRVEFKPGLQDENIDRMPSPRSTDSVKTKRDYNYECMKTIAAFLNTYGGTLFIGLDDNGKPYDVTDNDVIKKCDEIQKRVASIFCAHIGAKYIDRFDMLPYEIEKGITLTVVVCEKSDEPIFVKYYGGIHKNLFFVRVGSSTRELRDEEMVKYINKYFPKWVSR